MARCSLPPDCSLLLLLATKPVRPLVGDELVVEIVLYEVIFYQLLFSGTAARQRTSSHVRNESLERGREEVFDEPELDGTFRMAQDRDDHEERHTLVKQP